MDSGLIISLVSRFLHVGTAIVLVGGTTFLRLVVHPALVTSHPELLSDLRQRWKKFVHAGIGLFLLTGFYNYLVVGIPAHKGDPVYHMVVGTKIILALFVFFIASVLVGRSAGTQKFRDQAPKWTGIMLLVSFLIVGMSSFVKVRPVPVKPVSAAAAEESASGSAGTDATGPSEEKPAAE